MDADLAYQSDGSGSGERNLGTPGTDFSCVGATPAVGDGSDITIRIPLAKFEDFTTPLEGMRVRACAAPDTGCSSPIAETTSGADGVALVTVPTATVRGNVGFTGYVEISGPAVDGTEYVPYLLYFSRALMADSEFPNFMVQPAELGPKFHSLVGADASLIDARGVLMLDARDCTLSSAGDVRFSLGNACQQMDSESVEFYFREGAPSGSAKSTEPALPLGGFLNLLPGENVTARGFWRTAEQDLMFAEKSVIIRAGHLTTVRLDPNR